MTLKTYQKHYSSEEINVGDVVVFYKTYNEDHIEIITDEVTRGIYYRIDIPKIAGICTEVNGNQITVQVDDIAEVNTTGLICIGDKLTVSTQEGKATAIKYIKQDQNIFNIVSIGKVIGLCRDITKATVLLDIE